MQSRAWKSHILAGAEAAAWASTCSASLLSSRARAARRRGQRCTHRQGPQADRHFQVDTDAPLVHSWLRGFLSSCGLGPGSLETPASPAPSPTPWWNSEPRFGLGTGLDDLSRCVRCRSSINSAVFYHPCGWVPAPCPAPEPATTHLTPAPGPGSFLQKAPSELGAPALRLHTRGPETAEGQVSGKTHVLPESLPQCSFGCILFNT